MATNQILKTFQQVLMCPTTPKTDNTDSPTVTLPQTANPKPKTALIPKTDLPAFALPQTSNPKPKTCLFPNTDHSAFAALWDMEAKSLLAGKDHPFDFNKLYSVKHFKEHQQILDFPNFFVNVACQLSNNKVI